MPEDAMGARSRAGSEGLADGRDLSGDGAVVDVQVVIMPMRLRICSWSDGSHTSVLLCWTGPVHLENVYHCVLTEYSVASPRRPAPREEACHDGCAIEGVSRRGER